MVAVTTGGFGAVGTVVGAYFGVKLATDGPQAAQRAEAPKVQALAAHLDSDTADTALKQAGQLIPPAR